MNNHEGERLTPSIAKILIIELFNGQRKQLQEIKTKVEETHVKRGGLPPTTHYSPVPRALRQLKESGIAENPRLGYWTIPARSLDAFINWAGKFDEDEYVFRGVPNEEYKIQASAYRRSAENDRSFEQFLHVNKDLIRAAKQRGYDTEDGRQWNELDILVELQHFKAATCLIDFSFSAQVALWFACQPVRRKQDEQNDNTPVNGKVSAVRIKTRKYTEITPELWEKGDNEENEERRKIDFYLKEAKDSPLYYLQPKYQNNRIIAQQSVFLFGQYEIEADEDCVIAEACKEEILKELHRVSGITEDKIFPDFEGFAWVNREASLYTELTPSALKEQAEHAIETNDYEVAIDFCSTAINKDSDDAEAYTLRGRAYVGLKSDESYENALSDFTKAIERNKDYADAYYRRGIVKFYSDHNEEALVDFDKVIDLNPNHVEAYYYRAYSKVYLDRFNEAYQDLDIAYDLAYQISNAIMIDAISKLKSEIQPLVDSEVKDE